MTRVKSGDGKGGAVMSSPANWVHAVRRSVFWRSAASFVVVGVSGYLSLGTSCDDISVERETSATLHFPAGQAMATLDVLAEGGSVTLEFNGPVVVTRNGQSTEVGASYKTLCEIVEDRRVQTRCWSTETHEGVARYEIFRSDTSADLELTVRGVARAGGDCNGDPPPAVGLRLQPVTDP